MIRDAIAHELDHDPRFTWRGGAVTRIENLSDIVFALALGMLVSASTVPETYTALSDHLLNIVPVAAGFALLVLIWNAHFTYFRRYGVADTMIITLKAALLLFILFTAYPLRFIFDSLFGYVLGSITQDWSRLMTAGIDLHRAGVIMGYFAVGYGVIYLLISQMYAHALSKADLLGLNKTERQMTRQSIWSYRLQIVVVSTVGVLAVFTPLSAFAGSLMCLLWPIAYLVRRYIPVPPPEPTTV